MPCISLVAAMAQNRVIGKGLDIPWKIKGEQTRFKELTSGKVMVMGRLTYASIGRALPNRTNVILTRDRNFQADGCVVMHSLESVLQTYKNEDEIVIAGGGQLYADTINMADKIHLTVIERNFDGDIFFPEFNHEEFIATYKQTVEGEIPYTYYSYERRKYL
jgi:dihydrofolate reductase